MEERIVRTTEHRRSLNVVAIVPHPDDETYAMAGLLHPVGGTMVGT
jgi:LmbE family N-acetylglucosaminyl deacetylase